MPNIHELVDNVAAQIANNSVGEVWFPNLDLKMHTVNLRILTCNITGTYQFLTGFYGLGNMPNEFQRVMGSTLGSIPFTNC